MILSPNKSPSPSYVDEIDSETLKPTLSCLDLMEIDKSTVIIFRGIIKISHEGSKLSGEASLNPERERERGVDFIMDDVTMENSISHWWKWRGKGVMWWLSENSIIFISG